MRKADIKQGRLYATHSGIILECVDLGDGHFPRIPKFRTVFPFAEQERLLEPRAIARELSERETDVYHNKVSR